MIFFFGRLKLISRFGCQLWFVNMKIKKSMEWQVFDREGSQINHYKGVKNVALSIRLPNSQITFCPVRGFSIISATLVRLF